MPVGNIKKEEQMGPFGIPWTAFLVYLAGTIGMLVLGEIIVHSKKWKDAAEYYFHWNDELDLDKGADK